MFEPASYMTVAWCSWSSRVLNIEFGQGLQFKPGCDHLFAPFRYPLLISLTRSMPELPVWGLPLVARDFASWYCAETVREPRGR